MKKIIIISLLLILAVTGFAYYSIRPAPDPFANATELITIEKGPR